MDQGKGDEGVKDVKDVEEGEGDERRVREGERKGKMEKMKCIERKQVKEKKLTCV